MHAISASAARKHWSRLLNRVEYRKERIWIARHGKKPVALICADDLSRLERLEERYDIERAAAAYDEVTRGPRTHWFEAKRRAGV